MTVIKGRVKKKPGKERTSTFDSRAQACAYITLTTTGEASPGSRSES